MSSSRLAKLRELEAAAIPAPWPEAGQEPWENARPMPMNFIVTRPEDARLVVEARNALPELLSLVERLAEDGPWKFANECAGCGLDVRFFRKGTPHSQACPFLLLEQWKADE